MQRESIVFAISGAFFGLLVGWVLGTQQVRPAAPGMAAPAAQTAATAPAPTAPAPKPVDPEQVRALESAASTAPRDAKPRVQLGNLYFDAEQFTEAIRWYEQALQIDPRNVNVSTDLGVSYYYSNQADRALAQFDKSLSIDPTHAKTLLNVGIVRAFGKQDLKGASEAWEQVVKIAPDSEEGRAAKQALEAVKSAHPDLTGATPGVPSRGSE
ncbi:MAG TPA: tetratricopeptide repeat protein [Vicinamibacterales bacterium]|nr:tetratricopeptide repeat protein [Vicinamibacterales bacterium]